ncbi:hypothetical protein [Azospirillum agricola]|uniref:hypothetical protein n=1 Tax=Azospirillum agricola TaxID=1720247 RepID=UPI000A0F1D85|nr:hypothetical protein [Azospirillum agricola]SMH31814.1 hypothetical protein SAMN02982994_0515 [Azospirillum lipoferum]
MTGPGDASTGNSGPGNSGPGDAAAVTAAEGVATVHVPIVPPDGSTPPPDLALLRLVAGHHPVAPTRGNRELQTHIEPLQDFRAYTAGIVATAAVRALGMRRASGWRQPPLVWPSVSVANFKPGKGSPLTDRTCHSADLGIALALVLGLTRSGGTGTLIATGALGEPDMTARDAPILPVGCLETKFALILKRLEDKSIAGPGRLFTPVTTSDGRPVREAHREVLDAIAGHGLRILPVAGLRAAVAELGAETIPADPLPRWTRAAAAVALTAALGTAGKLVADAYADRPLPLAATADPATGLATPLRAKATDDRSGYIPLPGCRIGAVGRDAVRAGERLILRVESAGGTLDGLHHALVLVSAGSGVKLFTSEMVEAVADGGLNYAIPVAEPAEPGLVVVLARRTRPFDGTAVSRDLRAAMEGLAPTERLNAAANHLRSQAPGYLGIPIQVLKAGDPACADG